MVSARSLAQAASEVRNTFLVRRTKLILSTKAVCRPNAPSANRPSIGLRSTGVISALRKIYSLNDREQLSRRLRDTRTAYLIYSWQVVRQHTTHAHPSTSPRVHLYPHRHQPPCAKHLPRRQARPHAQSEYYIAAASRPTPRPINLDISRHYCPPSRP